MANCLLLKRLFRYTWQEIKGAHNPGNSNRGRKEGIQNRSRNNRIWFPGDLNTGNISNNNNYIADKKLSIHWLPFARHWSKHCILFNAHETSAKYILFVNFIRNSGCIEFKNDLNTLQLFLSGNGAYFSHRLNILACFHPHNTTCVTL